MSKAFTRETDSDEDGEPELPALPGGGKNYITPHGYARLRAELLQLMDDERPKVVEAVHWAARNGDRSENGDYIYGKKRLREIDRRIRFLTKRLKHKDAERFISVEWSDEPVRPFETGVLVTVANGKGVLARVAAALATAEADITHVDMDDEEAQDATDLRFVIAVRDKAHLEAVLAKLKRTASVMRAQRVRPGSGSS
jgi:transcription elongation factor GreB